MARRKKNKYPLRDAWLALSTTVHLLIAGLIGTAIAAIIGIYISWEYAPLAFWDMTAFVSVSALWFSLKTLDTAGTKQHATREDPGQGPITILMLIASVASLAAVLVLVVQAKDAEGIRLALLVGFGIVSVVISWLVVHFVYMLRYADLYFQEDGSIDFNTKEGPTYQDFAYIAFTIGMTYQVSDTSLKTRELRKTARQHALLSYLFGTVIIATTINAVASLGK